MKLKEKIDKLLEYVLITIMSILVIDVLWQVLSRYVLASPSSFTDELAGFLLIWVGLLGAAYVAGKHGHLSIDLLVRHSKPKTQKKLLIAINVFVALFALLVMIIGGSWLVITRFMFNVKSAALHLPLGYVYIVLPLGGIIILFYSIYFIIKPDTEQ
ncbi:MAG: TRAP transporter small permease [Chlamydiae bacterium]|nr:MAG: TRAP transporter small permease [Chlamydiota bacterium]